MKIQEYFLCIKKTKLTTVLNNFFFSVSASTMMTHEQPFLGLERVSCIAVHGDSESSQISTKISQLVFPKMNEGLGNDMRVSN